MKKALMIVAIIGIIIIAGSMLYYFVFYRPGIVKVELKLQEQKLELEKEKQKATEVSIEKDREDRLQQEANEEQQELNKKAALEKALNDLDVWYNEAMQKVNESYKENWYNECISRGLAPESPLPKDVADHLEELRQKGFERVNKEYQSQKDGLFKLYE